MKEQLYIILQQLVAANSIRLHKEELKLQLVSHPSYPSLHSITGVLDHFGIPNLAIKLPVNQEILKELPSSFLAKINSDQGDKLVLVIKTKNALKITSDDGTTAKMQPDAFLAAWDGIIIAIEKDETVKEQTKHSSFALKASVIITSLIVLTWFFKTADSLFVSAHFLLSLIGLSISILIVRHELGINSKFTEKLCNSSEKSSCESVLKSKGAQIYAGIKLSDLAVVAFGGYVLNALLLAATQNPNASLTAITTLVGIPVVLYSIYYQAVVVKKWCPLCLGIVATLLLQAGTLFIDGNVLSSIFVTTPSAIVFGLSMGLVAIGWSVLKPLYQNNTAFRALQIKAFKFKRNFKLFSTLLFGEKQIDYSPIRSEIVLGNPDAPVQLTMVSSPFCYYCKEAHRDLTTILEKAGNKIAVRLRFMVGKTPEKADYKIASELLHLYHTQERKEIQKQLAVLYADKANPTQWIADQNIHYNPEYDKVLVIQKKWCKINAINFTPALFVNGYPFPSEYDRSDLLLFIDDLIEGFEQQQKAVV